MNETDPHPIYLQLREYKPQVDYWMSLLGIGGLMGSIASVMSEDMRTFKGMLRCQLLAVGAAYISGALCEAYQLSQGFTHALVGLAALYANFLFISLFKILKYFLDDPRTLLQMVSERFIKKDKP